MRWLQKRPLLYGVTVMTFEDFWARYPKRDAKQDALKAWRQLKPDAATVTAILTALEWQCQSRQWQDRQYIPHAGSYLRGRRWEDQRLGERRQGDRRAAYLYPCPHSPMCANTRSCCQKQDSEAA